MRILLSNDDGYLAPGIQTLFQFLNNHEKVRDCVMIAPDRNRSAASNSLTLTHPLRIHHYAPKILSVDGTPTDCVHLGINGALDYQADMVMSGINEGANMGDDVLYSGTVAAATEGRFLGLPAIAVSLCGHQHYDAAAQVVGVLLNKLPGLKLDRNTVLNVNVPDIPFKQIRGIQITRLGKRHASEPVVSSRDPRGKLIHWIGPAGQAADAGQGTDFYAVERGYVSITPLQIDLTHYRMLEPLADWLNS
ncbi:stationary phase survival protein SurE [Thiomicrospira aerophila AL3]|uniref:5'-nucleotidase SurE n=1 Tax=Thiomicrospira aerophila AL3 TaxID=717772 RepID=W0DVK9_9GAMM|nr:5'/3'-nucleotidase SurE [Thiomicrospira aerophila]AHF01308.1 stationary phase survival protein SurE [Thiomicrospira aerophila AL3]